MSRSPTRLCGALAAFPLLLIAAGETGAASTLGVARATVIAPVSIPSVNFTVAMPPLIVRPPSSSAAPASPASALSESLGGNAGTASTPANPVIAGVAVSGIDGNVVSFSIAGETTSAYVVQLAPSPSQAAAPGTSVAASSTLAGNAGGATTSQPTGSQAAAPGGSSGLILSAPPLNGSGRLSIVLSQANSQLVPGALSLSVNYN